MEAEVEAILVVGGEAAAEVEAEAEALSAAAVVESERLTRMVSSRSLCIIRVASSGRGCFEKRRGGRSDLRDRELRERNFERASKLSSRCKKAWH